MTTKTKTTPPAAARREQELAVEIAEIERGLAELEQNAQKQEAAAAECDERYQAGINRSFGRPVEGILEDLDALGEQRDRYLRTAEVERRRMVALREVRKLDELKAEHAHLVEERKDREQREADAKEAELLTFEADGLAAVLEQWDVGMAQIVRRLNEISGRLAQLNSRSALGVEVAYYTVLAGRTLELANREKASFARNLEDTTWQRHLPAPPAQETVSAHKARLRREIPYSATDQRTGGTVKPESGLPEGARTGFPDPAFSVTDGGSGVRLHLGGGPKIGPGLAR